MVTVQIRTEELGNLKFDVHVTDQGSEKRNLEEARAALLRFAEKISEARIGLIVASMTK
jgi:hypothetical protein